LWSSNAVHCDSRFCDQPPVAIGSITFRVDLQAMAQDPDTVAAFADDDPLAVQFLDAHRFPTLVAAGGG
jgi:hypothetical protein